MKSNKRKTNRGLIVLNRGERIAMINLMALIVILLGFSVFRPVIPLGKKERKAFHNLDSLIAVREKAKAALETMHEERSQQPPDESQGETPSNPTEAPSHPGKTGAAPTPKSTPKTIPATPKKPSVPAKAIPILDINMADSLALVDLPQIGEVMASRIHRYRNRLGGFVAFEQLYEIYGMDSTRFATITPYIRLDHKEITKINVNQDEFKTLLRHPYLEYEQVKAIVNQRERKGLIKDWEQLKGIIGDVSPYLKAYVNF